MRPIVVERNPTYYNLIGRIEYRASFGTMVTDFREIKAGALHRANGGYLVLDVLDVLRHPFAWEALKRALRSAETRIENLGEEFTAVPIATLRPEPIPLDVKVVLLGTPYVYQVLYQLDEDFRELFKVKADFAPELDWTREHHENYAAFVSRWVRENGLRHFDRAAVATLIEHGARLREHQRKLSTRLIEISDVVSEASFWAEKLGHPLVEAGDVDLALRKKEYRSSLIEERVRELVRDGTLVITTEGERVGQVNGLAILDLGDHSFGRPSRVSARVSLGRGGIESIEREIELSGPIHSKGFMILSATSRPRTRRSGRSPPRRRSPSSRATTRSRATPPPRPSSTRCSRRSPGFRSPRASPSPAPSTSTGTCRPSAASRGRSRGSTPSARRRGSPARRACSSRRRTSRT